jgi:Zn-dependent protease
MKWSLKLGRFSGIDVYMHFTFILLISWVAFVNWRQGQSIAAASVAVLFILAIFLCVVLHEFGHALSARHYGIKTRDIILLPIGGVARLERLPTIRFCFSSPFSSGSAPPRKQAWPSLKRRLAVFRFSRP